MKIVPALILFIFAASASAQDCSHHSTAINNLERQMRNGGSAHQISNWKKRLKLHQDASQQCKRLNGDGEKIRVASGSTQYKKTKYRSEKQYKSKLSNPQLQQLIKTCNFWIAEQNKKPSPENRAFKDNACRDARTMETELINPTEKVVYTQVKRVKDCIKPNNTLDNEVRACMEGKLIPYWKVK